MNLRDKYKYLLELGKVHNDIVSKRVTHINNTLPIFKTTYIQANISYNDEGVEYTMGHFGLKLITDSDNNYEDSVLITLYKNNKFNLPARYDNPTQYNTLVHISDLNPTNVANIINRMAKQARYAKTKKEAKELSGLAITPEEALVRTSKDKLEVEKTYLEEILSNK